MTLTRKTFCTSLAGATVTLWLQGCGGGSDYGSDGGGGGNPAGSTCGAAGNDISANHGHALSIPKADLDAPANRTYALTPSTEGHVHSVTFTPAQLTTMKGGGSVTVTSTTTAASGLYGGTHSHSVTAQVAVATCP